MISLKIRVVVLPGLANFPVREQHINLDHNHAQNLITTDTLTVTSKNQYELDHGIELFGVTYA
jgi:hypothetical protein